MIMPCLDRPFATFMVALGILTPVAIAHTYHGPTAGACRGIGGVNDKINSKHVNERNLSTCQEDCDAEPQCKGFSFHPTANLGECIVYGPGMAGSCSDSTASSPAACAALGNCANSNFATQDECGTCSEASATTAKTCQSVVGTWNALTWTSRGATWNDADDPWTGEWHSSTLVKGVVAAAGYQCWDVDPADHQAACTGINAACMAAFQNKAENLQIASNCPTGCTFKSAVRAVKTVVAHAPAIPMAGYKVWSGACRGPTTAKVNGKYSNTAGASGGALTQQECAAACNAEIACVGYSHSTAWCVVYGADIDKSPGVGWTSDTHVQTTISITKVNPAYICVVKLPKEDKKVEKKGENHHDVSYGARRWDGGFLLVTVVIAMATPS